RHSESAACGDINEANHRIQANFIGTPCCVAPGRRVLASPWKRRRQQRRWSDMAYWGGQRLYGALARAPKAAEVRIGPVPASTRGGKSARTVSARNRIVPEQG